MIFGAAMVAVVMTSCTNSEILDMSEGRAISFKNTVMTRATTPLTGNGTFNINAYKAASSVAHGATVEFSDIYNLATDKYTDVPMYYYDGINSYWFYGYAKTNVTTAAVATALDAGVTATYTSALTPTLAFTAPGNVDLVVMATGEKAIGTAQNPQMNIVFYHALSRVRFTAKTQTYEPTKSKIVVTDITFTTPKNACTINKFDQPSTLAHVVASGSTGTYAISSGFQTEVTATSATVEASANTAFFVVPQQLSATSLIVGYTVGGVTRSKTFDLSGLTLYPGKSYNFEIIINLNEITFNATLEEWAEETKTYTEGPTIS